MAGVYKLDILESEAELKELLRQEKVIVSMVGRPHILAALSIVNI